MHELRRLAYLEALGVECYVSRRQLPGAAVSRRIPITIRPRVIQPVAAVSAPVIPEITALAPRPEIAATSFPPQGKRATHAEREEDAALQSMPQARSIPRFSLVTMVAGDWLWLEELGDMPLTTEQVQLVQSMAYALRRCRGDTGSTAPAPVRPDVLQFDWPMHNNRQLDLGEDAARAGISAFVGRRLEQSGGRGIVLLGQPCANRVLPHTLDVVTVCTASSADILQTPSLKRQVWQDLQPLVLTA